MIQTKCPQCGATLPPGVPVQACPACLLQLGLAAGRPDDRPPTPSGGAKFQPPPPEELAPLFPQLEILELLGHGGMGAVYLARQTALDRMVALKIIKPDAAENPAFAERFNREARTLARLSHPHIVAVHDFGQSQGLFFFVMEYVEGANLRQMMDAGQLSPKEALAIVPQICEALQYAHDEGVVHRDIKPENILVDRRGRVKIADFGLAKLAAAASDFALTETHQVMGTIRYMAPEQMVGTHTVDHRADIYSLGVVFYEMLTGELPLGRFEPPSHKVQIDVRLDEVVLRTLAKEPERRYQHASELKTAVETLSSQPKAAAESPAARTDYVVGSAPLSEMLSPDFLVWGRLGQPGATRATRNLILLVAAVGVLVMFFPWAKLWVHAQGRPPVSYVVHGLHFWFPVLSSMLSLALCGLVLWNFRRPHDPVLALGAIATGLAHGLAAGFVLLGAPLPNHPTAYADATRRIFGQASGPWATTLSSLVHSPNVDVQLAADGFTYLALAVGVALVLLGLVELRSVVEAREQQFARNPRGLLAAPAAALFAAGIAAIAALPLAIALWLAYLIWTGGDFPETAFPIWLIVFLPVHLLHVVLLSWVIVSGARAMERGQRRWLAIAGSIAAMLPLSLAWIIGLPAGLWALATLLRDDVRQLFARSNSSESLTEEKRPDPQRAARQELADARRQVRGPAIGLFAAGVLNWIATPLLLALFVPWAQQRRIADLPERLFLVAAVALLVSTLILCGAVLMARLRSYWVAVAGSIAAMLVTPGNLLGLPMGIWALVTLSDRRVREAFFRNRLGAAPELRDWNPPQDYKPSTLGRAWNDWWAERDRWFTTSVQTVLVIVFFGCMVLFFSFSNSEQQHVRVIKIGQPHPWFHLETYPEPLTPFRWSFNYLASSMGVALLGFAAYWVYWRIEKAKPDARTGWVGSPNFMLIGWGLMVFIAVALGMSRIVTLPRADEVQAKAKNSEVAGTGAVAETTVAPNMDALLQAAKRGSVSELRRALATGADVNDKDAEGQTALMKAAERGHVSAVLSLILLGGNLYERDNEGRDAIIIAAENNRAAVLQALYDLEVQLNVVRREAKEGDARAALKQHLAGVDVRLFDEIGPRIPELEIVSTGKDGRGETAMMKTAAGGHIEAAMVLQDWWEAAAMQDEKGRTAAMHAVENGQLAFLRAMRDKPITGMGTSVGNFQHHPMLSPKALSLRSAEGKTALQLAEETGSDEIAALLRDEMQRAVDHFTRAIEAGDKYLWLYYEHRAQAHAALGNNEQAASDLAEASRLQQDGRQSGDMK